MVNKLLVETAKEFIIKSNGNCNAVIMNGLYTGIQRLHVDDKFGTKNFFIPYVEGEYFQYNEMYRNVNSTNFFLAVRVDNKILTGEELKTWCEETCNGDIKEIKKKLNLKFGKIEKDFEFSERESSVFNRKIENVQLVRMFKNKYDELIYKRTILTLIKRKKDIQEKANLTQEEIKELEICNEEISKLDKELISSISKLSQEEIMKLLEINSKQTFEMYSGDNIELIANFYGITDEQLKTIVKSKAEERARLELAGSDKSNKKTGKQKQIKARLMGELKGKYDLNDIKYKIQKDEELTKEELERLENEGINAIAYIESIKKRNKDFNHELRKEGQIKQKVRKYEKDEDFIKSIVMSEVIKKPKRETIDKIARRKSILTIRTKLEDIKEEDFVIRDIIITIDSILIKLNLGKKLDKYEQYIIKKLQSEYNIDIEDVYKKSNADKEGLERTARKDEFEKILSSITVGINESEQINKVISSIKGKQCKRVKYDNITYGLNWYIASADKDEIDAYIDENAEEKDEQKMRQTMQKMIETEDEVGRKEQLKLKYEELFCISMSSINKCIQNVKTSEIVNTINTLKSTSHIEKLTYESIK